MASKRLETQASAEIITLSEKSALSVELQYGLESKPTAELVIAEKYNAGGEWKYSRTQIRMDCTKENAQKLTDAIAQMYKASAKVKKEPKAAKVTSALSALTADEKAELLKVLLADAKTPAKTTAKAEELVLESKLTNKSKRR